MIFIIPIVIDIHDHRLKIFTSCQTDEEKKQVMDMLYKYKHAFSLRDEMGMCPNIEVEIDVTEKSSFFNRPYHITEDK